MKTSDSFMGERNPDGLKALRIVLTIGGSGAVASYAGFGLDDTRPPVRTAQGVYRMTLDRACFGLVDFKASFQRQAGTAILHADLVTDGSQGNRDIIFETKVAAGTATDPASGDKVFVTAIIDETGLYK